MPRIRLPRECFHADANKGLDCLTCVSINFLATRKNTRTKRTWYLRVHSTFVYFIERAIFSGAARRLVEQDVEKNATHPKDIRRLRQIARPAIELFRSHVAGSSDGNPFLTGSPCTFVITL